MLYICCQIISNRHVAVLRDTAPLKQLEKMSHCHCFEPFPYHLSITVLTNEGYLMSKALSYLVRVCKTIFFNCF